MEKIEEILLAFKSGGKSMQEVLEYLEKLPFEDLCFAKVDHHRCLRRGFAEVIYGEGKTADQIAAIARSMIRIRQQHTHYQGGYTEGRGDHGPDRPIGLSPAGSSAYFKQEEVSRACSGRDDSCNLCRVLRYWRLQKRRRLLPSSWEIR